MNRLVKKDYKRRIKFKNYELIYIMLKGIIYNQYIIYKIRMHAQFLISKFPLNAYISRVRNRCVVTGRGRGIYSKYKLSRIELRNKINNGEIAGIIKSSW